MIYTSTDGKTWTPDTVVTVNETVTIQAYAEKDGARSAVVSFTYTVKTADEPTAATLAKLEEAPADGDQVVIFYPADKLVMTAAAHWPQVWHWSAPRLRYATRLLGSWPRSSGPYHRPYTQDPRV